MPSGAGWRGRTCNTCAEKEELVSGRGGDVRDVGNRLEGQDPDRLGAGGLKEGGSGLHVKCDARIGFCDEKAAAGLGEASFRGKVGAEEDCGISIRLEERCFFHYQARGEGRGR